MSNLYSSHCTLCGHTMRLYAHSINKPLVSALTQAFKQEGSFNLQKDLKLTKNQYNNFQKLQYWGLVEKQGGTTYWIITELGRDFIKGIKSIDNKAFTFGKAIQTLDSPIVKMSMAIVKKVYVKDVVKEDYQKLVDFIS